MNELERLARLQDLPAAQGVPRRQGCILVKPGEFGCVTQIGIGPEDRRRIGQSSRVLAEPGEAHEDRPRDRLGAKLGQQRSPVRRGLNIVARGRAEQLEQEEGVAAGGLVARHHKCLIPGPAGVLTHQFGHGADAQRRWLDRAHARGGPNPRQHFLTVPIGGARRREDQYRQAHEPAGQVHKPPAGLGIGPVQVVDRDQQRRGVGEVGQEPIQAMDHGQLVSPSDRFVGRIKQELRWGGGTCEHALPVSRPERADGGLE